MTARSTERFDVAPLRARASGTAWRAFRTEAARGEHGADLAEHRWWRRAGFPLGALGSAAAILFAPALVLFLPQDEIAELGIHVLYIAVLFPVMMALAVFFGFWLPRRELWGPRARRRSRLEAFARRNGLAYVSVAHLGPLAPDVFSAGAVDLAREHFDRISEPGRFTVANYREVDSRGDDESTSSEVGYVLFSLRESYPHTGVARSKRKIPYRLRMVDSTTGPADTLMWSRKPESPLLRRLLDTGVVERSFGPGRSNRIEIFGDELFLLRIGGYYAIDSPQFWSWVEAIEAALEPFLASPVAVDPGPMVLPRRDAPGALPE